MGALRQTLAELDETDRQLVKLKCFDDLSYRDMAAQTGLSISNVGYYRCARYTAKGQPRHRVPERELDRQILELFDRMRIEDDSVRDWFRAVLVSQTRDAQAESLSQRSELQRQSTLLVEQQDRLLNMRLNQEIDEATFGSKSTELRDRLASIKLQLDAIAASNEDARVQLENLQTQQAIVGLNTRRQRLYLDNNRDDAVAVDNQQLREAAADNPVLQQDQLNFRPQQLSQLLRGNTTEDNAILSQIAARLVQHQRASERAPRAILISLPEEGTVYTFGRTVQVAENQPLELDLDFGSESRMRPWQLAVVLTLLVTLFVGLALGSQNLGVSRSYRTVSV